MKFDQGLLGICLGQMMSMHDRRNNTRDLRVADDFSKLNLVHGKVSGRLAEEWA